MRFPKGWLDGWPRAPAVPIAISLMLGIAAARAAPPSRWLVAATLALAAGALAAAWRLRRRRHLGPSLALCLGVALIGAADAQRAAFLFARDEVARFAGDAPRLARLRLYLPNPPRLRLGDNERFRRPPRQATLARALAIRGAGGWIDATGDLLVQINEPRDDLAAGQTIEAIGLLQRPGVAVNPGQFDWQAYYRDAGVLASFQVRRAENIAVVSRDAAPLLTRWREATRAWLARGFSDDRSLDRALLTALVLGDYDPELRDVKEQFRRTGTSHHLAISGMHVALVGGLAFLVARLCFAGPRTCWLIALAVVLAYGAAATPSPPVGRAVILFATAAVGFLVGRFTSALQLLMLTVALMLAFAPLDLFNSGFQLSFGTVLGLVLLSDRLARRWSGDDVAILLPDEAAKLPVGRRAARWADRQSIRAISVGVIAWLVSMPLVASHFTQLNPWQVPASLVLGPIVTVCLFLGVAKILFTAILPGSAPILASLAGHASGSMRWIVDELGRLPMSDVPLPAPPLWLVALCWVSLALAIVRWNLASVRLGTIALCAFAFGLMLVGPYVSGSAATLPRGAMRVTLMSVGAGQCALVEASNDRATMIDCGSSSLADVTNNVVAPVLRARGRTSLDTIFVSHGDADHYSGVPEVAKGYGVREVIVGTGFSGRLASNAFGEQAMEALAKLDLPPRVARPGDRVPLSRDAEIEILWPPPERQKGVADNDASLVVRLRKAGRTMLFTGDIQTDGMRGLMESGVELKSDVLVAPHHGSSENITPEFLKAVSPRFVLASDDRTPTAKQRRFDAMCAEAGLPLYRTHDYGAITITIGADGAMGVEGFARKIELTAETRSRGEETK